MNREILNPHINNPSNTQESYAEIAFKEYGMPEEEYYHYASVLISFREYSSYVMREIYRRKKHYNKLSENHKKRLPPNSTLHSIPRFIQAIRCSQDILDMICQIQLQMGPPVNLPTPGPKRTLTSPAHHFSKLQSTLHQCVRDWSAEGSEERRLCYSPIVEELEKLLPIKTNNRNRQKVLVPGAGLGRLALEIASKGYATQGNEFSYQMLFTSNFLLNSLPNLKHILDMKFSTKKAEEFTIYPWIHNPSNSFSIDDLLRPVKIPDINPSTMLKEQPDGSSPDFSMCAGEFLDAYKDQSECWDCIVTCFFIDAAPNVIEYIECFERLLKPNGIWINIGPLLYHWQDGHAEDDERYSQSVELSLEEIKHVMKTFNFEILNEFTKECIYTCNIGSMMKTVYNCAFFSAQKKSRISS